LLSRTAKPYRVVEYQAVFDFERREDRMAVIRALARRSTRIVNASGLAPGWNAS
jgi:hypothetical protein